MFFVASTLRGSTNNIIKVDVHKQALPFCTCAECSDMTRVARRSKASPTLYSHPPHGLFELHMGAPYNNGEYVYECMSYSTKFARQRY